MAHYKDTLCWRCKGNNGPSRAFAFWQIARNERPHRENGQPGPGSGSSTSGDPAPNPSCAGNGVTDKVAKCECAAAPESAELTRDLCVENERDTSEPVTSGWFREPGASGTCGTFFFVGQMPLLQCDTTAKVLFLQCSD